MLRKIGAAWLAVSTALFCACSSSSNSDPASIAVKSSSASADAAFSVPQNTSQPPRSAELTYFGNSDISGAEELFKKNSGGTVTIEKVGVKTESEYLNALSEKISADASPDLCDKVDNTFPYLVSLNLYEDLTNYIDITSPQWADITEYIDYYAFNGSKYFYPTSVKIMPQFLMYDKMIYAYSGSASDPEKLWMRGEWTRSTMMSGAEEIRKLGVGDIVYLATGMDIVDNFIAASGSPLFPRDESGRFMYGSESGAEQIYFDFLGETWKFKYDCDIGDLTQPFSVFLAGDEETLAQLRQTSIMVGIVPFPVEDGADAYYCKAQTGGFLVPKGAKNIQSAASFINCSRIYETSEENIAENNKRLIESGLLRSDVEWLEDLRESNKITPIIIEDNCFDYQTNAAVKKMLAYKGDEPWQDVLAQSRPVIDRAIERINAMIE